MRNNKRHWAAAVALAISWLVHPAARADVVTDWSGTAADIAVAGKLPPGGSYRVIAVAQAAVYEAVNAITRRYPATRVSLPAAPDASIEAAVAAANRATLSRLVPAQQAAIDNAYAAALSAIADDAAKAAGVAVGEQAAAALLAACADDGFEAKEAYRPQTQPGAYVPTGTPELSQWPQRKPWLLTRADQFRPGPPPDLRSAQWARDYNEIKSIGAKNSTQRTVEQTEIARFWEARVPTIYLPVVRSLADAPGRDPVQNARLLAVATQAMDDALIAVADAKYHYGFWRPITAIRNGDADGNAATERDASWLSFIDTPMHPEYPCAHCVLSGAIGAVLQAEAGAGPLPVLSTTSPTAPGIKHSWTQIAQFTQEVANARVYDGVHFRTSTEVGTAMGEKIGALAAVKYLQPARLADTRRHSLANSPHKP